MDRLPLLGIDHLVLDTVDLERALGFYALLPGAKIRREPGRGVVLMGRQKLNIHLHPSTLAPLAAQPVPGGQEFCLTVNGDLGEMVALLGARGIPVDCTGPLPRLADPDGNSIGLVAGHQGGPVSCAGIAGLTLPLRDVEAGARFYRHLGALSREESGKDCRILFTGGFIRLVPADGKPVGAGDFCLLAGVPVEAAFSFCASKARPAPETGIVARTGALGPMRSFYLRDPAGNLVEIAAYPPQA